MIISRNLKGRSLCPHHFLPIEYQANFAYTPEENVVGASKIYTVFETIAAQPIMQEDLTHEFIEEFEKRVKPKGCIIVVTGKFFCHEKEGIDSHEATMTTTLATEIFKDKDSEKRFFDLI